MHLNHSIARYLSPCFATGNLFCVGVPIATTLVVGRNVIDLDKSRIRIDIYGCRTRIDILKYDPSVASIEF